MKKILIPTMPEDQHAIFVKKALENKGHLGILWYTADFPSLQTHSFKVSKNCFKWESKGPSFSISEINDFDVVWWRRPQLPVLPDYVHVDDAKNATKENNELFKTFSNVIAPDAFWVNKTSASTKSSSKLLQLKVATEHGLTIPETLISNDPQIIKNFILKNNITNTIYKPLYPVAWKENSNLRITYTREINLSMLPNDNILQSTAGIFQRKINKAYELRVNIMGNSCIAAKLESQSNPKGKMDWRYIPPHELIVKEYDLPQVIYQKCRAFMKQLNLVFGCFDFIVTPDGEYYFLEINEQGQFLWIEDINPNIKILDVFTDFLISGDDNFICKKNSSSLSIVNYYEEMKVIKKHAVKTHKEPAPHL